MSTTLIDLAIVVIAPFVGSFIGLAVLRRCTGAPIVRGRSRCPECGRTLRSVELVPLVSWLALGGRCLGCGTRIGVYYPAMELAALGLAIWAVAVAPAWIGWVGAALGWALLALAAIDLREMVLPDSLTLPLIAAGLLVASTAFGEPLDHLIGAGVGGFGFAALGWGWERVTGREALGLGDAKLFAAAGAWLGWQALPSVLLIAALAGLAMAFVRTAVNRGGLRAPMPFGPALAAGFWLTWAHGPIQFA